LNWCGQLFYDAYNLQILYVLTILKIECDTQLLSTWL